MQQFSPQYHLSLYPCMEHRCGRSECESRVNGSSMVPKTSWQGRSRRPCGQEANEAERNTPRLPRMGIAISHVQRLSGRPAPNAAQMPGHRSCSITGPRSLPPTIMDTKISPKHSFSDEQCAQDVSYACSSSTLLSLCSKPEVEASDSRCYLVDPCAQL